MDDEALIAKLAAPTVLSLHVDLEDAVVIRDALAMYRSPIKGNMGLRDCLLEMVQEKLDRAASLEDLPEDWLQRQYAACGLSYQAQEA